MTGARGLGEFINLKVHAQLTDPFVALASHGKHSTSPLVDPRPAPRHSSRMRHVLAASLLAVPALAQSNAVPGLDVRLYDVADVAVYGRRGPVFPGGEVGINIGHSMCNGGSVALPWVGTGSGGIMLQTFPKIASLLVRESNGRMVQVSGKSNLKHSRTAFNFTTGPCAPCNVGGSNQWGVGCADIYSSGFSSASNLGPTDEIDPWLGTWNPVGSYFDRGDPPVAGAQATDGIQSPINNSDPLLNRMIVSEADLATAGTFYGQAHLMVIGEPIGNRGNNQSSRQMTFTRSGTTWTSGVTGSVVVGPVLTRWTGAATAIGSNGSNDGRFMVGCKVTGPVDGFWHYEIAMHNLDNAAGGAAVRIPVCGAARVRNAGFHDIDRDATNDWVMNRTTNEIAFLMGDSNPLNWNTIYNVWFDCDAAPVSGTLAIDRARAGAGANSVSVAAQVPGLLGHEYLGAGCGTPTPTLVANGVPASPNGSYTLRAQGTALAPVALVLSLAGANTSLGNGCVRFVDPALVIASLASAADGAGGSVWGLPIPAGLSPFDLFAQQAEVVAGGPWLGSIALSNGLRVRVAGAGCQ